MRTIMRSRAGRWTVALAIGLALGFAARRETRSDQATVVPAIRASYPTSAVRVISPILPLRKSFTAWTISASLFITNGP
jgi:hypothetical protein